MEAILLNEIIQAVDGDLGGCGGLNAVRVSGVSTDTRTLLPGDLFVALAGKNFEGHDYAHEAVRKGAAALMLCKERMRKERMRKERAGYTAPVPVVAVEDTGRALLALGAYWRRKHAAAVAGITGSAGKTTTKDLLARILSAAGPTIASERSFNNFIGVPLTLLKITAQTRYAVVEIGTNAPGEVAALALAARPGIGIVTNVSPAHLEGLGSLRGVAEEKAALLRHLEPSGTAILNRDDEHCGFLRAAAIEGGAARIVTYGIGRPPAGRALAADADFAASRVREGAEKVAFNVGNVRVHLDIIGRHNVANCTAALACAAELGVPLADAAAALRGFTALAMRLERRRAGDLTIFNDAYNANPASVAAALRTFAACPGPRTERRTERVEASRKKCVVLGDMLELGAESFELHRRAGAELAGGDFGFIALVGTHAGDYAHGALQSGVPAARIEIYRTVDEALAQIPARVAPGDFVLVKGSRGMGLERIVAALESFGRGAACGVRPQCDTGTVL